MGNVSTPLRLNGAGRATVLCPDCGGTFPDRETFVLHREKEHPPAPTEISGLGAIDSQTRFGTDPDKE